MESITSAAEEDHVLDLKDSSKYKKESNDRDRSTYDNEQAKDSKTIIRSSSSSSSTTKMMTAMSELNEAILSPDRIQSLFECDNQVMKYEPRSFLLVFHIRGRNLKMILLPLLYILIWDIAWAILFDRVTSLHTFQKNVIELEDVTSPLLVPVSFLLVFRLGRAGVRFWDARSAMGKLVEVSRTFMSTATVGCILQQQNQYHQNTVSVCNESNENLTIKQQQQLQQTLLLVDGFARWTCVLPVTVKNFLRPDLRNRWNKQERLEKRRSEIGQLLSKKDMKEVLDEDPAVYGPILVLNRLRELAFQASSFTPQQQQHHQQLGMMLYRQLNEQIDALTGAWGAMERINSTPLPFVYVVHLRTFLLLYLFLWNLEYVAGNGWIAIVPLMAGSWGLLGIEAAAVECERPFRWHSNHLPLGNMGVTVARNVSQTLKDLTEKKNIDDTEQRLS